jgi:hypothetical protein
VGLVKVHASWPGHTHITGEKKKKNVVPKFFSIDSIIPVRCVHCIYICDTPHIKSGQFVVHNKVFFIFLSVIDIIYVTIYYDKD